MLREISYEHFLEWKTFAELEPFDEEREDIRAAQITSAIVNMGRDPKKHRKPFPLQEFQLRFGDTPAYVKPKQTWQQMKTIGRMMFEAYSLEHNKQQKAA